MICESCVRKHEFLLHYDAYCLNKSAQLSEDQNTTKEGENAESYCKKPNGKSAKVSAKFWADVSIKLFLKLQILNNIYFLLKIKYCFLIAQNQFKKKVV